MIRLLEGVFFNKKKNILFLNIGDDVIVYPDLMASLVNLAITDAVIKVGTAPAPALDNNIIINRDEMAEFDSTRITVTII